MRNKIMILVLLLTLMLSGCEKKHENGVPAYFLEPDGYVIASVRSKNATFYYRGKYGYILEKDYKAYLNGKLDGILVIKHPYQKEKETTIPYSEIESININEYIDYRY